MYIHGLYVRFGELQQLKDLDLSDAKVAFNTHERYGDNPPLEETIISPASIFSSPQLVDVTAK